MAHTICEAIKNRIKMSAATFTPELKSTTRKDGTRAVRIRITKFREHSYWNMGKYILPGQWNKTPSPKLHNYIIKHDNAAQINNAIKNALTGLDQIADAFPAATAAGIKVAYEKALRPPQEKEQAAPVPFFQYADDYLGRKAAINFTSVYGDQYYVAEYKAVIGEHVPLSELFNSRNAQKFLKHLKEKGNSPVTIKNKFTKIRAIYRAGVKENIFPPAEIFAEVELIVPKQKKPRPQADQVKQFITYQPTGKFQAMAKNVTILQYLLQGARIMEALTLEWANVHPAYVEYLPQKKARKPKFIPRSPLLNKLLEEQANNGSRYVLPYIGEDFESLTLEKKHHRRNRVTREVNTGLKQIAEALGIDVKLSSHMFRHAFADAVIQTGASIHQAAALLGHSNPATTERYIKDLQMQDVSAFALSIFNQLEEPENNGENLGEQ